MKAFCFIKAAESFIWNELKSYIQLKNMRFIEMTENHYSLHGEFIAGKGAQGFVAGDDRGKLVVHFFEHGIQEVPTLKTKVLTRELE